MIDPNSYEQQPYARNFLLCSLGIDGPKTRELPCSIVEAVIPGYCLCFRVRCPKVQLGVGRTT